MEKILPLEECSIRQLYLDSEEVKTYMIPIYQRNYAWEEDEVTALVKDIHDSIKAKHTPYYIGTLVTYNRGDNEYEVIDGQQRLTTIYIILKALGVVTCKNRLTYGARKVSASTIDNLDRYPNLPEEVDRGIINGYKFAMKAIQTIVADSERKDFETFFLENVHIIHYQVPKDVDLNHYFEVMNSRGEQLEKQEIVKSMLSQHLNDKSENDKSELATFCRVWEACSEMNIYIQQAFPCKEVFGSDMSRFQISDFSGIPLQNKLEGKSSILKILEASIGKLEEQNNKELVDKFQPIIDFPNFLLIVLKLTMMSKAGFKLTDFTLDDKELLKEFDKALRSVGDKAEFARTFSFNLLKAKYLLDNFVVHHVANDKELPGDNPWKLQRYYEESTKKKYPKNISSSLEIQKELVHLLSMFEVTFTAKQRKNYLFYCLTYLFEKITPDTNENVEVVSSYLAMLQSLAHKYFVDVYLNRECLNERNQPLPNAFDNKMLSGGCLQLDVVNHQIEAANQVFEEIYPEGRADIPLFVFNYTDYILWKRYADKLRGQRAKKGSSDREEFFKQLGCSDFELDPFNNFYFSRTRKSLEHYYPQAKATEETVSETQINCFGNFAMIGAEANSSGSNWDPKTKLTHYSDKKANPISVASLKFRIMMQMCQDNINACSNGNLIRHAGMEWNAEDIRNHQSRILNILVEGLTTGNTPQAD